MTKQEIKDETNKLMDRCYTKGSRDLMVFQRQKFLNELFPLLDGLDVVIKVDRELPLVSEVDVDAWSAAVLNGIETGQRFMVDAGYVATKSLIGESSPPTFRDGSTLALAVHSGEHEYPSPTSVEWPYLPSGDDLRFQTTCDDTGYDLPYPLSTWVWK